jgi:hypothetical protein
MIASSDMLCPNKKATTIPSSIRVMECCGLHDRDFCSKEENNNSASYANALLQTVVSA